MRPRKRFAPSPARVVGSLSRGRVELTRSRWPNLSSQRHEQITTRRRALRRQLRALPRRDAENIARSGLRSPDLVALQYEAPQHQSSSGAAGVRLEVNLGPAHRAIREQRDRLPPPPLPSCGSRATRCSDGRCPSQATMESCCSISRRRAVAHVFSSGSVWRRSLLGPEMRSTGEVRETDRRREALHKAFARRLSRARGSTMLLSSPMRQDDRSRARERRRGRGSTSLTTP